MERYESWIDRAKSSYELSKNTIYGVFYEDLCFQLQQAVEKVFKGLLIYYGIEPEFTHNIGILLNKLEKHIEIPENIKVSTDLTKYAVQTRYPGEYDDITKEEYGKSLKIANACLNWVENKIKEEKETESTTSP
jgi:HEPN domain-containing protein